MNININEEDYSIIKQAIIKAGTKFEIEEGAEGNEFIIADEYKPFIAEDYITKTKEQETTDQFTFVINSIRNNQ